MIYIIGNTGNTQIKIGYSKKPNKRVKQLQTGNGDKLDILCVFEGGYGDEKERHRCLNDFRINNERFDGSTNEILNLIKRMKSGIDYSTYKLMYPNNSSIETYFTHINILPNNELHIIRSTPIS